MKKILLFAGLSCAFAFSLCVGIAFAGRLMISNLGPTATSPSGSAGGTITIAAAGAGNKNCLTDVDATSDAQYNFRILDGTTTGYNVVITSGAAIVRSWSELTAFCGSVNTAMYITISNGNSNVNYIGFVGQ